MLNILEKIYYQDGQLYSKATNKPYRNYDRDGYIRVRQNNKEYRAHRLIWELHHGEIPSGMLIDHIDGNVRNNDISNLRLATRQQNNANRNKLDSSVLPKGVIRYSKYYRARITYNGTTYSLGSYSTVEEAEEAYKEAAYILNGEFAKN